MVKIMCISISDWVYSTYLQDKTKNRSKFIEELIVKGIESQLNPTEGSKQALLNLVKENNQLKNDISNLSSKIETLKNNLDIIKNKKKRDDHLTQQEIDDVKYLFDNRTRDMNYWLHESKRVLDNNRFFLKGRWQLFINTFSYNISKAQFSYLMKLYDESLVQDNNKKEGGEEDVEEMQ